jgi:hypothetical protein
MSREPDDDTNDIPDTPEWPVAIARSQFMSQRERDRPNEWKRLEVVVEIGKDGVFLNIWALTRSGPRVVDGKMLQGFGQRGRVQVPMKFTKASSAGFHEEFLGFMFEHGISENSTLFNFFDDFRDEGRLQKALVMTPDLLFDKRIQRGMKLAAVKEIFGPLSKIRHYIDVNTYKTFVRNGNMIGDCFFIYLVENPDSLAGLRWQYSVPHNCLTDESIRSIVKYAKGIFANAKEKFGKPKSTTGKITISAVFEALQSQISTLPLRQLGFFIPFFQIPENTDIFVARFANGGSMSVYAMYVPVFGGRIELSISLVPLPGESTVEE